MMTIHYLHIQRSPHLVSKSQGKAQGFKVKEEMTFEKTAYRTIKRFGIDFF